MPRKSSRCKERIRSATAVTLAFLIVFCAATFPTAASAVPQGDSWETLAHMQVGRTSFGAASVGGKIYAISGLDLSFMGGMVNTNEVYDVATDNWTMKQPIPTGKAGFATAAVRNRIYCIGGYRERPMASMEIYDTLTDTWSEGSGMPKAREYAEADVVNGKIYVMGGKYTPYSVSDQNLMYDPQTGAWTAKAPIPHSPGVHISAVLDNKIYIISGGLTQIYNTETDTWSTGAPFPGSRIGAYAAATTGVYAPKRIYVIEGATAYGPWRNTNWVFDPQANSWSTAASPPYPGGGGGVTVVNDQIYIIGGVSPSPAQMDVCQRYTPVGCHSAPLPSLSVSVLFPGGGESGLYGDVDLVFAVNREAVDVASVSYRLDGQAAVPVGGNVTIDGLSVGTHSLSVKVVDVLENSVTTQTVAFTVGKEGKSEPFPIVWVAVAVIGSAAAVSFGLVAYFLKRKSKRRSPP
jgi:N-acetylneuraminic acid mutarotase